MALADFQHPDPPTLIGSSSSSGGAGLHGTGDPTDNAVAAGTTYVDDSNGHFWVKTNSGWLELIN